MEKEIELEQEAIVVYSGGGAVNSVNGYTGDVVLTTSDLENTSDYQTGTEVESAISTAIAGKQDNLTAGNNITISNNTISATDTTYSAGTGLTLNGTQFSVDTSTIATQQDVSDEATARENADINLQGQIDAISAASDVTDIVGTYADLQAYDTQHLKDNDIIKVLQDESQNDETTYYRWSTSTQTFTLIGEEGPYYTKSQTDTLLQAKQDNLTAGANITIASDNTISATDTTYTAGTNVSISSGNVISATDTTYSDFTGTDGTAAGTAGLVPAPATTDAGKFLKADGTWDTAGGGVVQTTGTSTTDVMSQNAVTSMVFADPSTKSKVNIGNGSTAVGDYAVAIGRSAQVNNANGSVALGFNANVGSAHHWSVALGANSSTTSNGEVSFGGPGVSGLGYNNSNYRLLTNVYDPQSAHDAATKGYVDAITLTNAGAPTTSTVGTVGQLLEDTTNGKLYICTDTTGGTYTWEEVGAGGGGGPTVVQTTGTSTTDVMSQNAVTSMVFADPATQSKIKIGAGTSSSEGTDGIEIGHYAGATGSNSIAIGVASNAYDTGAVAIGQSSYASAPNSIFIGDKNGAGNGATGYASIGIGIGARSTGQGSVALGATSRATAKGQFDIGANDTYYGYNSSNYRLLTGLYDPQSAHDAATKGYVDPTTDSSAPTTATVGRLGQIQIDTTTATAYMCVAVDTVTPAYTWKQITA